MRKQTKLVAVLSAAALLAIGASMTSMAATRGWVQEDGEWYYLNSNGERATETWKRSGDYYYWFDENGDMAKNQIVEHNGNYYYVNEDGARVSNQWVAVDNEEGDTVDGKEVEVLWYYLGTTGRAYKSDDPDMLKTSLIDGKRYFFDENGRMVSGWTTTMDSASKENTYYLGDENQGWATTDWAFLEIPEEIQGQYDVDEAWFHFGSSGKADKDKRAYIKNAYYAFDENGVMLDDWKRASDIEYASATSVKLYTGKENETLYDGKTFYNLETGNQGSGWVHTYQGDEEGGDEKWFYLVSTDYNRAFNNNGKDSHAYDKDSSGANVGPDYATTSVQKYVSGETDGDPLTEVAAKVIKGKTYLFNNKGEMLSGVYELGGKIACSGGQALRGGFYYFNKNGGSVEGRMEKGRTTIDYDGEKFTYYFTQNGSACVDQINDGAVYGVNGVRVEAKDGNANQVFDIATITNGLEAGKVNGKVRVYTEGSIVVSSTGKIRTGSVVIDDVKYVIENYVVVKAYDRYDSTESNLQNMFTKPEVVYITLDEKGNVTKIEAQEYERDAKGKWILKK